PSVSRSTLFSSIAASSRASAISSAAACLPASRSTMVALLSASLSSPSCAYHTMPTDTATMTPAGMAILVSILTFLNANMRHLAEDVMAAVQSLGLLTPGLMQRDKSMCSRQERQPDHAAADIRKHERRVGRAG